MPIEYKLIERTNSAGTVCVAPFIAGWNVWDIPKNEYTPAVEEAIKHAYSLGLRFMEDEMCDKAADARHDLELK